MQTMIDYCQAGYCKRQTDSVWSSNMWVAEQAGKICRERGLFPREVKMSRGYSVIVNRRHIIKFNTQTLEFESITTKDNQ